MLFYPFYRKLGTVFSRRTQIKFTHSVNLVEILTLTLDLTFPDQCFCYCLELLWLFSSFQLEFE